MYRAYALRPAGATELFNSGGPYDGAFAVNSSVILGWDAQNYRKTTGHFTGTYFERWFTDRGLINSTFGPEMPAFPYYENVAPIVEAMRCFVESYVDSFYADDTAIVTDSELQAWLVEANGPAQVLSFPPAPVTCRETLVDILTHMMYLTGVLHGTMNSHALAESWWLPLHPTAHYQPLPKSKGVSSVIPFLPNATQAVQQISLMLAFNRPAYRYQGLDLPAIFDQDFLNRTNDATVAAAGVFRQSLVKMSLFNQEKMFDANGLSEGMPFIWKTADPLRLPFFLDI
jgi:hypothetical protein